MNRVLTQTEIKIVQALRTHNPENKKQFESLGYKLEYLGDGLYRTAYRIVETDLVVKIPKDTEDSRHSLNEVKIWNKLLRSPLAKIVPPLRYHNPTGIVVTDLLNVQADTDSQTQEELSKWREELQFPDGMYSLDLHPHNIGIYNQRFVILDMGCFQI